MKVETLSQRESILMLLQQAGSSGVCGTRLLDMHLPRYAARISELRVEGYTITTRTCRHPYHQHSTRQVEYVLHTDGQPPLF